MIWHLLLIGSIAVTVTADDVCNNMLRSEDWEFIVSHCKGRTVIGRIPNEFILYADRLTEQEFNEFLANAVEITMCIVVEYTNFNSLRFPKLKEWNSCNAGLALKVIGNDDLETIIFDNEIEFYGDHTVHMAEIRGNRRLSRKTIASLARVFSAYNFQVPQHGECALSGKVEDLSLLNCDAYYGDIYFNKDVNGEIPTSGSLVDGCLVVKDTLLTDIEFIRSFNFNPSHKCKNEISGNPHLCISKELERHLIAKMNITIKDNMNTNCRWYVDRFVVIVVLMGTYFILFSFTAICLKAYISMK